jgi:CSLREA domain-containing protein
VLVALVVWVLALASAARAAVIQVNTTMDELTPGDGLCSLREAISDVDTPGSEGDCGIPGGGANTIELGPGVYHLTIDATSPDSSLSGDLDIGSAVSGLTIQGAGIGPADATTTQIAASANGDRVLDVAAGASVALSDLVISGGHASPGLPGDPSGTKNGGGGENGGGIDNAGSLTLSRVVVADNHAGRGGDGIFGGRGGDGGNGGGISNSGTLALTDSTIELNSAGAGGNGGGEEHGGGGGAGGDGGGIANAGTLTLERTTVSQNITGAGGSGGMGDTSGGNGNQGGSGGGIFTGFPARLTATNSTLSGNFAGGGGAGGDASNSPGAGGMGGSGGGLAVAVQGASLVNATVADNARGAGGMGGAFIGGGPPGSGGQAGAGGGIASPAGCAGTCTRLENSIVAVNAGGNCSGAITDGLGNLVSDASTCPGTQADPKLGPLQDNGGPTATMALRAGSPAMDLVPPDQGCPATDQRGVARPQGSRCDAGAYEVGPPVLAGAGAAAAGSSSATVSASVNPNERATSVVARYGTSSAYGSTSAAVDAGAGNTAVSVSVPLTGLSAATTYHAQLVATNADGSTSSSDLVFTTPAAAAGGGSPKAPSAPVVSAVHQSAQRWLEGNQLASISAKRKLPVGTIFSFAVSEPATVTFTFTQSVPGRRVGGGCAPLSNRSVRKRRCSATILRGRLSLSAHQGVNRVRFEGLLARGRRLKPGTYTVTLTAAVVGAPPSTPAKLTFTIVRRVR